jgi:hypothetical protein
LATIRYAPAAAPKGGLEMGRSGGLGHSLPLPLTHARIFQESGAGSRTTSTNLSPKTASAAFEQKEATGKTAQAASGKKATRMRGRRGVTLEPVVID